MSRHIDRRDFLKAATLSPGLASSVASLAQRKRNLKIGHTGITWVQAPFLGYYPLGQGKVNIPEILDSMDGRQIAGRIMVELDGTPGPPMTDLETAAIAKAYLEKQGVVFRNS